MKQMFFFPFLVLGILTFYCQGEVKRPITEADKGFLNGLINNEFGQPFSGAPVEKGMSIIR